MEKKGIKKKGHTRMKIPPGQLIRYYGLRIWRDMGNLLKWLLLASLTGDREMAQSILEERGE